jgi:hypothetical protein
MKKVGSRRPVERAATLEDTYLCGCKALSEPAPSPMFAAPCVGLSDRLCRFEFSRVRLIKEDFGPTDTSMTTIAPLPFLTELDPVVSGEGALDPLGLSSISERLAERILPGLRARMSRPRFLTAMAVCSAVCEGLEDELAPDGVTPAYLVFEWLLVEALVRADDRDNARRTPGIQKAQLVIDSGEVMSARTYLKTPTVFGFNGVYKPLARNLRIVDDDLGLSDTGYNLLKVWQDEHGQRGFLDSSLASGSGNSMRRILQKAVDDGLASGCTSRQSSWQGWQWLSDNLMPATISRAEADLISRHLGQGDDIRGEIFRLLRKVRGEKYEAVAVYETLIPQASSELRCRLEAIARFEELATIVEDSFDWIRHISTSAGARAIGVGEFARNANVKRLLEKLPKAMHASDEAIANEPKQIEELYSAFVTSFGKVSSAEDLFESLLARHESVQRAKPPEGKRSWFERDPAGATIVRIQYRLPKPPSQNAWWRRPYRIDAARSFLTDFTRAL